MLIKKRLAATKFEIIFSKGSLEHQHQLNVRERETGRRWRVRQSKVSRKCRQLTL